MKENVSGCFFSEHSVYHRRRFAMSLFSIGQTLTPVTRM